MGNLTSRGTSAASLPPNPQQLLKHRNDKSPYTRARVRHEDTPLSVVYRIYTGVLVGQDLWVRTELEYFFNHPAWSVAQIPDPEDPDRSRYIVLAAVTYLMVASFNKLIIMGLPRVAPSIISSEEEEELRNQPKLLESAPTWAELVPAFEHTLVIPDGRGNKLDDLNDETADPFMLRKNILTPALPIYFV